jgi:hypothetical protein
MGALAQLAVKLLPHEFKSWKQPLTETQGKAAKAAYIGPKVVRPFPELCAPGYPFCFVFCCIDVF